MEVRKSDFPHQTLDGLLHKYVDDKGRVDYKGLAADRDDLLRYLKAVQTVSPHSNPELFATSEERLAYWINAYNAYVLFAVTSRPAMRSVNDEKVDFFYLTKYELGGDAINLYDIENEIVRPEFSEPRVHMALNCASGGCPELPAEAFTPAKLEEQLAREAAEFCAHPTKVQVEGDKVRVSSIFDWYSADFERDGGPIKFCTKWGRADLPDRKPEFLEYDWRLNAQPGKALFD